MGVFVLSLLLTAFPPASHAEQLAKRKAWDTLLMEFGSAKTMAKEYSKADAARVSRALTQGCQALEKEDPVIAMGLGERASSLFPTAGGLLCWARTARKLE